MEAWLIEAEEDKKNIITAFKTGFADIIGGWRKRLSFKLSYANNVVS